MTIHGTSRPPRVSIVLLNCNRNDDTIACIQSLRETGEANVTIILVDNGTLPNPEQIYKSQFPEVIFLRNDKNLGTPIGNNVGIRHAIEQGYEYVMMLNNDTVVGKNFLRPLLDTMEKDPSIGIAGGKIYFRSDPELIWFAGGSYNRITTEVRHIGIRQYDSDVSDWTPEPDFISGCYALLRVSALYTVGVLDERFFAYMEDVDLCLRFRKAGFRLRYVPEAVIWHKVSTTIKVDSPFYLYFNMRNRLFMLAKHCSSWERMKSIPYLTYYYGRHLIRLAVKWRYWAGVKAVLYGIFDGLRHYEGTHGMGHLPVLSHE